jgi:hypothetical protein
MRAVQFTLVKSLKKLIKWLLGTRILLYSLSKGKSIFLVTTSKASWVVAPPLKDSLPRCSCKISHLQILSEWEQEHFQLLFLLISNYLCGVKAYLENFARFPTIQRWISLLVNSLGECIWLGREWEWLARSWWLLDESHSWKNRFTRWKNCDFY